MSKPEVLKSIVGLVASLQKSLHKVRQKTSANTEELDTLRGSCSVAYLQHNREIAEAKKAIEDFRVQAFQRSEAIAALLAKVKAENDDRETRQTMRDQNNVAGIQMLERSMVKAFGNVKTDIQNLVDQNRTLRESISQVVNGQELPIGHEWVNKKLTGVYDTTTDLDNRLQKIEYRLMPTCVAPGTSWEWKRVDELQERVLKLEAIIKIIESERRIEATEQLERRVELLEAKQDSEVSVTVEITKS